MKQTTRLKVKVFTFYHNLRQSTSGDLKHEAFHGAFLVAKATSFLYKTMPSMCVHMLQCSTYKNFPNNYR